MVYAECEMGNTLVRGFDAKDCLREWVELYAQNLSFLSSNENLSDFLTIVPANYISTL